MASFYEDASLVVIPSGYKTSKIYAEKPTDGSGDLTFTRASGATRVASNGLIEKVRTNLILQSNTFSTTWLNSNSTETSGQAGYDGTNNAWLLTATSAGGFLYQDATIAGLTTFSIYAKAGSEIGITLYSAHASQGRYFNLSTGALGGTFVGTPLDSKIESIGSGWYRCSITVSATATNNFRVYVSNGTANVTGNILIQDAQLEVGDIAPAYIPTTTAAVSVGPVSNVPRLDYLGSSCPRLLLEPQRTNVITFSENFDNAAWTKENATITANSVISPDGYTNADTLADNSTSGRHRVSQTYSATSGTSYTFSVFVKKNSSGRFLLLNAATLFNARAVLSLDTLQITNLNGTGKVEDYGNGWYRFSVTGTATATASTAVYIQMQNAATDANYVGDGSSFYLWGAQLEAGSYATSYIPTLAASVTRVADAASKTGISSLIGQTGGVLYVDFVPQNNQIASTQQWLMFLGSVSTYISIFLSNGGKIRANVADTTDQCAIDTSYNFVAGTRYKCALAYKANDFAFYVNGALVGTDTSGTVPAVSTLQNNYNTTAANGTNAGINEMLLFTTRLTNAQMASLTSL